MKNRPAIYKILLIDGRCYVGSATSFDARRRRHLHDLRHNKHHSIKLQRAWNKYGEECFVFEVLEWCEKSDLVKREQFWLDTLQPVFNIELIARSSLGRKHSEETRFKLSIIAAHIQKGRKHSNESRLKRSLALRGRKPSPQCIAATVAACTGRALSPTHRANISAGLLRYNSTYGIQHSPQ
jgi:group I intron endonuclease